MLPTGSEYYVSFNLLVLDYYKTYLNMDCKTQYYFKKQKDLDKKKKQQHFKWPKGPAYYTIWFYTIAQSTFSYETFLKTTAVNILYASVVRTHFLQ